MLGIATIVKSAGGEITSSFDALIVLPAELRDKPRIGQYQSISAPGWSQTEFGYWAYAKLRENGDLYIFPGLRIVGEKRPSKRFHGYTVEFSKDQIEVYAQQLIDVADKYVQEVDADFNLLVHDLGSRPIKRLCKSVEF